MNVKDLLKTVREKNIDISLSGDNLQLSSETSEIPPALYERIRNNKADIISYLKKNRSSPVDYTPIPRASVQSSYPLSSSQMRLWIVSQLDKDITAYNMPGLYIIEGALDINAFEQSFSVLLARHENLRTIFKEDENGEVRQFVNLPETGPAIRQLDLRGEEGQAGLLEWHIQTEHRRPFNLAEGPLFRACLYQVEDKKWFFAYSLHHIICDGWSMTILMKELLLCYNAFIKSMPDPLTALRIQYKDYAVWQQEQLKSERAKTDKKYWLQQFQGELTVLDLPGLHARPAVKTYNGGCIRRVIDARLTHGLKTTSKGKGETLFMSLLSTVVALLYRYTGHEDITIGTTIAGREHADLEDQIGFYVNTLPLRVRFNGRDSYAELLHNIKEVTLEAYEHQLYPFNELVNELKLTRDRSRNPLFDIEVILQIGELNPGGQKKFDSLQVRAYEGAEDCQGLFDLVFKFLETGQELQTDIIYNSDVYDKGTVEKIGDHLVQLIDALTAYPDKAILSLDYLSPGEKHQLLTGFNDTAMPFPENSTIVDLFERQASLTPDRTALVYENKKYTYKELNEKCGQLAANIKGRVTTEANSLIGIMLERSDRMIIALLGVLKSGAAYVPIDPAYPAARKDYIIKDTAIRLLITQSGYVSDLSCEVPLFYIDTELDSLDTGKAYEKAAIDQDDLAYVIYTSGSSGDPKGVMITHGGISNTIHSQKILFNIVEGERGLQFASLSFDASIWEIFMMLTAGGTLYIVEEESRKNPQSLEQYIAERKIDIATMPPAYLKLMDTGRIRTLKKLITAGETAISDSAYSFADFGTYYNAYGPTESSICASVFRLDGRTADKTEALPIGIPIANTQIYILDKHLNLLPIGRIGEICIGGKGLARGYLNNPGLTAEKFIPHPFRKGQRMYRTGDLGKYRPDGNIEFVGRRDEQVKIRGYRIEPGEIEKALQKHQDIHTALVMAKTTKDGQKSLVAYLVGEKKLTSAAIRAYLVNILPSYMLPDTYVPLSEWPLTTNGKIDRNRLPDPAGLALPANGSRRPPENEMEEKMVAILQDLLGKDNIGVEDNFFEAGGNSITIIRLARSASKALNTEISIASLFQYTNIKSLVDFIGQQSYKRDEEFLDRGQLMDDLQKFNL